MSRWVKKSWLGVCLGITLAVNGGCSLIRPGSMQAVRPVSDSERAGNVYLVRGLIGIWSFGMDQLSDKLKDQGIRSHVYQDAQTGDLSAELVKTYRDNPNHEPIVLIGHSLGADDVIKLARALDEAGVQVDLLITVDPVLEDRIPKNVKMCLNYFRPNGAWDKLPMFRGIPVEPAVDPASGAASSATGGTARGAAEIRNYDVVNNRADLLEDKTNHFNIDKNPKVHDDIIKHVVATLPPRPKFLAMRSGTPLAARTEGHPAQLLAPGAQSSNPDTAQLAGHSHLAQQRTANTGTYDPANFDPKAHSRSQTPN